MKIALAQINVIIGDFENNLQKHIQFIRRAIEKKADLIVFPELSMTGYPPRDFLEFKDFVEKANQTVEKLLPFSKKIGIIIGAPTVNPVPEGKDLFNSAVFLADGKEIYRQHKTLLPTYDIFDEYRYFEPAKEWKAVTFKGKKIALSICEDIWNLGNENPLYTVNPLDFQMEQNPDLIINISASPFDYTHPEERLKVIRANVKAYGKPMIYVNHTGAQTDLIFDGASMVVNPQGEVLVKAKTFQEDLIVFDTGKMNQPVSKIQDDFNPMEMIYQALVLGIRDYFGKIGLKKAITGLSGGLDSAVVTVLAVHALGKENVRVLLMPSLFSSKHSVTDAKQLAENLGIQYDIIPIPGPFEKILEELSPLSIGKNISIAEENIQARIRMIYLMAVSNKYGNILLNTSNKSELAVGYGTLYGDMAGGLSVIGDLYKTQVYELARYINKKFNHVIPQNILTKPPSAELRPDQKDTDSLPPYEILDPVLKKYIEERKGPHEIIQEGFDRTLVHRVLKMVNRNEFKRYQTPPILRVSPKAFGMGRRLPIVAKYLE